MNPYLEKRRKEEDLAKVQAAEPAAQAEDNPYPVLESPIALASRGKVQGPELARALPQQEEIQEEPMQADTGRPAWHALLDLAPAAAMTFLHAQGKGTEETRAQANRYMQQATEASDANSRRVANSKVRARAYNNRLTQRKLERKRQASQDAIAAEDRGRRIGKEDLQASREAADYDPASPKNQSLKKAIAETYPEIWGKLTPEEQANLTVKNADTLSPAIEDEQRKRKVKDDRGTERSKQQAELEFNTNLPTVFQGNNYFGGGGGRPPDPNAAPTPNDNPFLPSLVKIYGDASKIPPTLMEHAGVAYKAYQAGQTAEETAKAHNDLIAAAYKEQGDTSTRNRQEAKDAEATKKAESQQDNQFATQRRLHKVDDLESNLNTVIQELSKEIGPVDPETGLFPSQVKGNISGAGATAWAGPFKGRQGRRTSKAVKELLDTKIRKATGAAANVGEERRFEEIMGWGPLMRDVDLVDGVNQAIKFLHDQQDVLDTYYPDAASRFHERKAEKQKAKEGAPKEEAPTKPTVQGGMIIFPKDGKMMQTKDTPANRKALGL